MIIRAIDQKIANAGGAHFTESDLLLRLHRLRSRLRICRIFAGFISQCFYRTVQQKSTAREISASTKRC